ncbi:MAG: S1 RNA-binding domain-containing protein [Candidatus Aenigmatarchaeota archaeon]
MRKKGMPQIDELVMCEVMKINPNSAYAKLLEYDRTGMIHVSEVAKRWVRDIREFVKERQIVVCKVIGIDREYISLSIKRINRNQADRRFQEFKRERNAEKFLEQVAKQFGISLEQAYEEIGYELDEKFGGLHRTFEIAVTNPELLAEKGISKKWADAIIDIAMKSFVEKIYEIKAMLSLTTTAPDGVDVIKKVLLGVAEKGLEVKYISAPAYQVSGSGKNAKKLRETLEAACTQAVGAVEAAGGEASFSLEGKG